MSNLTTELTAEVSKIFQDMWSKREGRVVPDTESLTLKNDAVTIEGTVLYADLSASTALVDENTPEFAAEVYKVYLRCAARIITSEGGTVTAYDGDRVMSVFVGGLKNTSAARAALKINYAVAKIINPRIQMQYPKTSYRVRQVVGIDTSSLLVAKTGVRGANDLVWVGKAANHAAKLCAISDSAAYITDTVYNRLQDEAKLSNGRPMWEARTWTQMGNQRVYRSDWLWTL